MDDMKKQVQKRQKRKAADSDDSDWSEIQKPGDSRIDKLIKSRNRFNIHYQKQDFVTIPEEHRFPLLPNQQIYDWLQQRKLLAVSKEINSKNYAMKQRQQRMQVNGEKDEVDNLVSNQWVNASKQEIDSRLRNDAMKLLEGASKQSDLSFFKLDSLQEPDLPQTEDFTNLRMKEYQTRYNDAKTKKKRGRPRKYPIKQMAQQLLRHALPQPPEQRKSQISQRRSAIATPIAKEIQKSRLIISHQRWEDEQSMDISLDLPEDYEESYFNTRKT